MRTRFLAAKLVVLSLGISQSTDAQAQNDSRLQQPLVGSHALQLQPQQAQPLPQTQP